MTRLFFFFCFIFAYLKWKIDDRLHAVDRTYANEEHRRPPLGLESKLNQKRQQDSERSGCCLILLEIGVYICVWAGKCKPVCFFVDS